MKFFWEKYKRDSGTKSPALWTDDDNASEHEPSIKHAGSMENIATSMTMHDLRAAENLGVTKEGEQRVIYLFRGDARTPENIFQNGFKPIKPGYRDEEFIVRPYVSDPSKVVPMSTNFNSAAIFATTAEFTSKTDERVPAWVYMIRSERAYNIGDSSIRTQNIILKDKNYDDDGETADYMNESVATKVEGYEVIAAIRIEHDGEQLNSSWDSYQLQQPTGDFLVKEVIMNPHCRTKPKNLPVAVNEYIDYLKKSIGTADTEPVKFNYNLGGPEAGSVQQGKSSPKKTRS